MGRKKSPTRKHSAQRYVDPEASRSSSSASEMPSRLDNVSPSSLRGLAATKEEMDTESSSDGVQLPSASFQGIRTALPIGDDAHKGRENRRKRRSSGDDAVDRRQEAAVDSSGDEERQEVVTISVAELEKWQQRVILHIEDHFTNEQLKRIAEFGRVHGSVVQEAKQYVSNMEVQLKNQFEEERAALRAQAEEFVAKTSAENAALRRQVEQLERQVDGLEKQVDVLEKEKVKNQQLDKERQVNRGQLLPTHSPPNHQTQVQPRNGEANVNTENQPTNGSHDTSRDESGGSDTSHPPLATKKGAGGTIDHCSTSKATHPVPRHDPGLETPQLQPPPPQQHHHLRQKQPPYSNVPVNGTRTHPDAVEHIAKPPGDLAAARESHGIS